LVARAFYETRILVGGADAKALVAMGLVVPIFPMSLLDIGSTSSSFLQVVPFAFNVLVDAALLSLAVPLGLAFRNLHAREFRWHGGFTTYSLPVDELPRRFVWVDDPALPNGGGEHEEETTAEDITRRTAEAEALRARGVSRVWVTPQLPFVFFLALGTIVGVVAGNLLWDLVVSL
jgi:preflagellin peptidase FlaK